MLSKMTPYPKLDRSETFSVDHHLYFKGVKCESCLWLLSFQFQMLEIDVFPASVWIPTIPNKKWDVHVHVELLISTMEKRFKFSSGFQLMVEMLSLWIQV
jgi:hypothetical protein